MEVINTMNMMYNDLTLTHYNFLKMNYGIIRIMSEMYMDDNNIDYYSYELMTKYPMFLSDPALELLLIAIFTNDNVLLEKILKNNSNLINIENDLLLRWAGEIGHLQIVKTLLKYGSNINCNNGEFLVNLLMIGDDIESIQSICDKYIDDIEYSSLNRMYIQSKKSSLEKVSAYLLSKLHINIVNNYKNLNYINTAF